jgi:hypothetical protein
MELFNPQVWEWDVEQIARQAFASASAVAGRW